MEKEEEKKVPKVDTVYIIPEEPGLAKLFKAICKLKGDSQREVVEGCIKKYVNENAGVKEAALALHGGKVD